MKNSNLFESVDKFSDTLLSIITIMVSIMTVILLLQLMIK